MTAAKSTEADEQGFPLPGTPPKQLAACWAALGAPGKALLIEHLQGGTSAEYMAAELTRVGYRISASSIRTYRRQLARLGV